MHNNSLPKQTNIKQTHIKNNTMIKISELEKIYRTEEVETVALNKLSFEVKQGEFVVAWSIGRATTPGSAEQILVYEKKAPTDGGAVLLRDGTIKQVTAGEFAAAPKAR